MRPILKLRSECRLPILSGKISEISGALVDVVLQNFFIRLDGCTLSPSNGTGSSAWHTQCHSASDRSNTHIRQSQSHSFRRMDHWCDGTDPPHFTRSARKISTQKNGSQNRFRGAQVSSQKIPSRSRDANNSPALRGRCGPFGRTMCSFGTSISSSTRVYCIDLWVYPASRPCPVQNPFRKEETKSTRSHRWSWVVEWRGNLPSKGF